MTEHYTLATESVTIFCPRCMKPTQRAVSNHRADPRPEHGPKRYRTKRQEQSEAQRQHDRANPKLF